MPTSVLICDDSSLARKKVARALPEELDASVTFASNGEEALAAIKAGYGDILFLDLNMPGMDGYSVLEAIREADLPTITIVVSADIQPQAQERVRQLGALGFVKKPIRERAIAEILQKYGLYQPKAKQGQDGEIDIDFWDGFKEVANVSIGQAGDLLARLLDVVVVMPIPTINIVNPNDLRQAIRRFAGSDSIAMVSQGFIGSGIAGEALVIFNEASVSNVGEILSYKGEISDFSQPEQVAEIASIVTGACLKGIAEQMDVRFSLSYPLMIGHRIMASDLNSLIATPWDSALAIELICAIENRRFSFDIFLLFTEDSVAVLRDKINYIYG